MLLFQKMSFSINLKTQRKPSLHDIAEEFEAAEHSKDGGVAIFMSSKISGTANTAQMQKVCKLFFNLHTLFYKLIWTKQSVKIYSRIVCASDCVCANKAAKAQSEELVYLRTGRASGCS